MWESLQNLICFRIILQEYSTHDPWIFLFLQKYFPQASMHHWKIYARFTRDSVDIWWQRRQTTRKLTKITSIFTYQGTVANCWHTVTEFLKMYDVSSGSELKDWENRLTEVPTPGLMIILETVQGRFSVLYFQVSGCSWNGSELNPDLRIQKNFV